MPGPASKDPSRRARRNSSTALRALPTQGRKGKAPTWPLMPDSVRTAQYELAQDRITNLEGEIENADDGRTKGRLRRQLAAAEQTAAIMKLQIEQQTDMELELWQMLWSTPQATMWDESDAFARVLASFVRWQVKGEQGDLDAAKEARIRGKEFGLTPLTLLGLKAEVERVDEAEDKSQQRRQRRQSKAKGTGGDPRSVMRDAG